MVRRHYIATGLTLVMGAVIWMSAYNLTHWRTCDCFRWEGGVAVLVAPASEKLIGTSMAPGRVSEINGIAMTSRTSFDWSLTQLAPGASNWYREAADPLNKRPFAAVTPRSPWTIAVILLVGMVFCGLGLFIWSKAEQNPVAGSFLRLNLATGVAILLDMHQNVYANSWVHGGYALTWMGSYVLIPAMFAGFTSRFSDAAGRLSITRAFWIYFPASLLVGGCAVAYLGAWQTRSTQWIDAYALVWRFGFGAAIVGYLSVAMFSLIRMGRRGVEAELRIRNRWLALTTAVGIAPYALLHRLPVIWGDDPKIPLATALLFLLIAPLGWGMAVASYRMLKIEWALSRAMTYTAAALLAVVIVFTTLVWATWNPFDDTLQYVPFVIVVGAILTVLSVITVYKGVGRIVDRVYFGDYFDFRREVQHLTTELSSHYHESGVREVLTQKLPALLHTAPAILLRLGARTDDPADLLPQVQSFLAGASDSEVLVPVPSHDELARSDIAYVLRLRHGAADRGCLLLKRKQVGAPFSARDLELIRSLSPVAGLALANVTLIENTIEQERRSMAAEFAGGIAHEINNALTPLRGQAQLLLRAITEDPDGASSKRIEHSTAIMIDMTGRIQRIADNLNRLAEPLRLSSARIRLEDVVRDALRILGETAGRTKRFSRTDPDAPYRLVEDYAPDAPAIVGDADQLCQAVVNLILNACDAMESGGHGILSLGTSYQRERNEVAVHVSDTGAGIPEQHRARVFEPYFTTKASGKGTGLGLGIVRLIAEAHGGTVSFFTEPGRGTTFQITLPVERA